MTVGTGLVLLNVLASAAYKLAEAVGLLDDREAKRFADVARTELERQISLLQMIQSGEKITEADLIPPKSLDTLLKEAGLGDVVDRNK